MSYELKKQDIYDFAQYIGAEVKEKAGELWFKKCPCCDDKTNDEYTFSINLESGAYNCFRASCGAKGHFVELCRDKGFKLEFDKQIIYRVLPQPKKPIESKDEAVAYLADRGISEEICRKYEITMSQTKIHTMVFPFRDENGKLQFIKYRNLFYKKGDKDPKEWCEKNTMPILFGMNHCTDFKRLVITEGQLDSLSVAQADIPNAVSVPTGALGFTWLVPCMEWISKFEEVVVFGDYENGKMTLLDSLRARLKNKVLAVRKQDYLGEKDANDILRKYGAGALQKAVENAETPAICNVKDLSTVRSVDINELEKINTNITRIDDVIGGLIMGQLVLLTGKRGEGKSTFMSQLVANALDQGKHVFVASFELADFHFKRWLDYQLAGERNLIDTGKTMDGNPVYSIPDDTIKRINDWYCGRAYIYDNEYISDDDEGYESIIDTIERVIKDYGVELVCIDNLMTAMDVVERQDNLYLAQSNFVGKLKKLAVKYNVVIILVAHPRKSGSELGNDDVSGSSDITNKADVVLAYKRCDDGKTGAVSIIKNRLFGFLKNDIELSYSKSTKRVGVWPDVKYGWEICEEDMKLDGWFTEALDDVFDN